MRTSGGLTSPATFTLEDNYGAPASGDVTTALQNAVNDILVTRGGGRLLLRDREYDFTSIQWPSVGLDKPTPVLEIVGPRSNPTVGFMPGVGLTLAQGADMPPPSTGAILKSTQPSAASFGGLSAQSNIMPVFRDVIVRVPPNPAWAGIDCGWCTNAILDNVVVDTGRSWGDGSNPLSAGPIIQPTHQIEGVVMPGEGNGGVSIARDLLVSGFYYGLRHSEHFDGDRVTLAKCIVGLRPSDGWHASRSGRLSLYWNQIGIQPVRFSGTASHPVTRLYIAELDFEEDAVGGNWYTTAYHISDPNNYLRGQANVHRMVPNSGPSTFLLRKGGAYFRDRTLAAPREQVDSVGFEGADTTNTLPASLAGQPSVQATSTWKIEGQRAAIVSPPASWAAAAWDFGASQFVLSTRFKAPTNAGLLNTGVALFVQDLNNLIFVALKQTQATIQKISAGTFTTLATSATYTAIANGAEVTLRAQVLGKVLRIYMGDTLLVSYTMTAAEWSAYSPNTAHGFFAYCAGFEPGGTNGTHWDHLRIERATVVAA